jgi:hypothetical protein
MLVGTGAALADRYDYGYYRDGRTVSYRDDERARDERIRHDTLSDRVHSLIDRVRTAHRRDRLSNRDTDRLLGRLDRINDLARRDHFVTVGEYRHWMGDLDDIERQFNRAIERDLNRSIDRDSYRRGDYYRDRDY